MSEMKHKKVKTSIFGKRNVPEHFSSKMISYDIGQIYDFGHPLSSINNPVFTDIYQTCYRKSERDSKGGLTSEEIRKYVVTKRLYAIFKLKYFSNVTKVVFKCRDKDIGHYNNTLVDISYDIINSKKGTGFIAKCQRPDTVLKGNIFCLYDKLFPDHTFDFNV